MNKCEFCDKLYNDCDLHFCEGYIKQIIKLGEEAGKQLEDFTKTLNEQADEALNILKDMRKPDGTKLEV